DFPGWKLYWKTRRALFLSGFQEYVDKLIKAERSVSSEIYKEVEITK
ncbi:MAG: hypothetical protein ACI88A_004137, partial [Paraglaciecola sp.]